jgi:hypothetical protein
MLIERVCETLLSLDEELNIDPIAKLLGSITLPYGRYGEWMRLEVSNLRNIEKSMGARSPAHTDTRNSNQS